MKTRFVQQWLNISGHAIPGMRSAVLFMGNRDGQDWHMLAKWPEDLSDIEDFGLILQYALAKNEPASVLSVQQPDKSLCDFFAHPVVFNSGLPGFIIAKINAVSKESHGEVFSSLKQAAGWLPLIDNTEEQPGNFYIPVFTLLASCLDQKTYREALIALVTELTRAFHCDQVALGEFKNRHSKVVALSNSAKFDDRSNFIQKIADAMDEAIEQDCLIVFPNPNTHVIQRAHQELARKFGSGSSLTVPMINHQATVGAVTLLRSEDRPFDAETISLCKLSMSLLTPFLALKKAEELSLARKIGRSIKSGLTGLFGFKRLKMKLAFAGLGSLLAAAALLKGDFQVTADAVLEGRMQRVVAAPIEGFLLSASVRAGDTVRQGDVLATLDDAELQLQLNKLNGQLQKARREYREALSINDLVKVRVTSAQIDQANAEMELARQQLQKIALTAPFDSIVIEGDLSQKLGSPVERGDILFKIAPLEGYRIILKVDERFISYVTPGQKGVLALSSMPDRDFGLTVEKITAVAKAEDKKNIFRVEASLDNAPEVLRPGMEGIGKINAGRRSLLWIWTHEPVDWLRLWLWSWWL